MGRGVSPERVFKCRKALSLSWEGSSAGGGRDICEGKLLEAERPRHTEELQNQIAERTAEIVRLKSQRAQIEHLVVMDRLAAGSRMKSITRSPGSRTPLCL